MSKVKTNTKVHDMSATQAKTVFGFTSQRLGQYCDAGIITRSKPGRVWMYSRYELECLKEFFKQRDIEDWASALADRLRSEETFKPIPVKAVEPESCQEKQECCKQERKDDGIVVAVDEPVAPLVINNTFVQRVPDVKKKRRWGRKGK